MLTKEIKLDAFAWFLLKVYLFSLPSSVNVVDKGALNKVRTSALVVYLVLILYWWLISKPLEYHYSGQAGDIRTQTNQLTELQRVSTWCRTQQHTGGGQSAKPILVKRQSVGIRIQPRRAVPNLPKLRHSHGWHGKLFKQHVDQAMACGDCQLLLIS